MLGAGSFLFLPRSALAWSGSSLASQSLALPSY